MKRSARFALLAIGLSACGPRPYGLSFTSPMGYQQETSYLRLRGYHYVTETVFGSLATLERRDSDVVDRVTIYRQDNRGASGVDQTGDLRRESVDVLTFELTAYRIDAKGNRHAIEASAGSKAQVDSMHLIERWARS